MENEELKQEYIDERTGITYILKEDYYIPNIAIPKDTNFTIGRYGNAHLSVNDKIRMYKND